MKKFSSLLLGVFLLWTVAVAIAEDVRALTGSLAEMPKTVSLTGLAQVTTWTTTEVTTWTTAEVATWTTAEVATWTTAEVATWTTAEVATWTTAEVATWTTAGVTTWTTAEVAPADTTTEKTVIISDSAKSKYSEEQIAAYEWAYSNGITTINDIEKARLDDWLTRAELAKMMSQYLSKVLWKEATTAEKANYADVDSSLGDLADFIQIAYAYKIMWVNADGTPLQYFNPNGKVTRAEYATVFSRVLYGDKYNKAEGNYYEDHIKALKNAGILTNDNPSIEEIRGWVMLMMLRSTNVKAESEESTGAVVGIANPASVYCEEQGGTLSIVEDAEGNQSGMCKLADGTEVEEWEYFRANHKEEVEAASWDVAPLYTEEDHSAAEKTIMEEGFGKMTVKVENVKLRYMGDEKSSTELKYCKELDSTVEECIVYDCEFYIPVQDAQMAWAFEPNTTLTGYQWYLGRVKWGEWKILTSGY